MAYISVDKWRTDQVTDWLKGLDDSMKMYVDSFTKMEVVGSQLLNIRPYELENLGMQLIGHQEIVLDAVENLRNIHHNLDTENLQFHALHVATAARSLHRQLSKYYDASQIETHILKDITHTIATIKPLIAWLNRAPFKGDGQFTELCMKMLRLGLEMATIAQRERFVEKPVDQIRKTVKVLEELANYIIQDITDPLILQPASLCLITFKKRESDLGFNIESSYHGVHRVTDIKLNSPANNAGKIEDGDEIVQINYQTVVGWQYKSVLKNLSESPPDVLLTLKKRPRHTKIYGQVYMQPYRLPSKKRVVGSRWGESVPSPRPDLLTVPDEKPSFNIPVVEKSTEVLLSDSDSDSELLTPTDVKETEKEKRLFYPKPRTMLQRRNTICGGELFGRMNYVSSLPSNWLDREKVGGATCDPSSPSLRDKSKSFGFGLEISPRPTTCIGIASANNGNSSGTPTHGKGIESETMKTTTKRNDSTKSTKDSAGTAISDKYKPGVSKVVRFDANMKYEDYHVDEKYTCNVENTILETFAPIPYADDDIDEGENDVLETLESSVEVAADEVTTEGDDKRASVPLAEAVNLPVVISMRRGRLDKSHSTPAYDNSGAESDTPPAIEPRKTMLTPPVPPPRPRKQKDLLSPPSVPPPPPKPPGMQQQQPLQVMTSTPKPPVPSVSSIKSSPSIGTVSDLNVVEVGELNTPTRTRTLTLRKKHNLIKRRRNVNLKLLGSSSDISISSHLYRRTKDHRGVTYWARLYFVMLDTILYGFRAKDAPKASSLIFLPGFTVSLAKEVHSKPHAFKVYHAAKTFYFAAESQDALNQWVDYIRAATVLSSSGNNTQKIGDDHDNINPKELFSETDSSGEENESLIAKNLSTPSPQGSSKDGSGALNTSTNSTPTSTTKQDFGYLDSLRKLTKGTLPFKSSSSAEKKVSRDIPVPTEQYRCFRKVPGGNNGIQIGTNTPGCPDSTFQTLLNNTTMAAATIVFKEKDNFNDEHTEPIPQKPPTHIAPPSPNLSQRTVTPLANSCNSLLNSSTDSTALGPPSSPAPTPADAIKIAASRKESTEDNTSPWSPSKKMPYNFIHASNPNLLEIDFQTSKALDYSLPKINPADSWDAHKNPHGFVTLKDLMLQKQEEEAQEMYNNRVLLGVEKKSKEERQRRAENNIASVHHQQQSVVAAVKVTGRNKLTSRVLPKTPDYEISFKPDDESIKRTRTKEGLKLRDFGYELITGDEPIGVSSLGSGGGSDITTSRQNSNTSTASTATMDHQQHQSHQELSWTSAAMKTRHLLKSQNFLSSVAHKSKKHSINSCSSVSSVDAGIIGSGGDKRTGSFKKKGKLEVIKSSSERLFQFSSKHSTTSGSTPAPNMMTMTLPLNKKSNHHVLGESGSGGPYITGGGSGIKKSHTYNHDLKDKAAGGKYDAHRKNSAPVPILSKLTTSGSSNKISKEKRLLGSPLLHRTLFGSSSNSSGNHQHHHHHQQQPPQHQSSSSIYSTTSTATMHTFDGREYDQEIFSQVTFSKVPSYHGTENGRRRMSSTTSHNTNASEVETPPPPLQQTTTTTTSTTTATTTPTTLTPLKTPATTPEYPHMECPPVFEPEIYSLSEPNTSLSLLLRRNNSSISTIKDEAKQ